MLQRLSIKKIFLSLAGIYILIGTFLLLTPFGDLCRNGSPQEGDFCYTYASISLGEPLLIIGLFGVASILIASLLKNRVTNTGLFILFFSFLILTFLTFADPSAGTSTFLNYDRDYIAVIAGLFLLVISTGVFLFQNIYFEYKKRK